MISATMIVATTAVLAAVWLAVVAWAELATTRPVPRPRLRPHGPRPRDGNFSNRHRR